MTNALAFDLAVQAGDDFDFNVTWTPDGAAPDLVGASAAMRIAWPKGITREDGPIDAGMVEVTSADGITFDTEAGVIAVHLSAAVTAGIPSTYATYQLRVETADTVVTTIAAGLFTALRSLFND
ncbi:hypothetical protein [uncultured Devosia sp.]|uniref:hypothetical protein n=1 Tax=uncultured Devosia sp. TaxID=211434 RepID=UPI002602BA45|nr:hypothetical protein [uncultured Devosia sp.]